MLETFRFELKPFQSKKYHYEKREKITFTRTSSKQIMNIYVDAIKNFWLRTRHSERACVCFIEIRHPSQRNFHETYLTDQETEAKLSFV